MYFYIIGHPPITTTDTHTHTDQILVVGFWALVQSTSRNTGNFSWHKMHFKSHPQHTQHFVSVSIFWYDANNLNLNLAISTFMGYIRSSPYWYVWQSVSFYVNTITSGIKSLIDKRKYFNMELVAFQWMEKLPGNRNDDVWQQAIYHDVIKWKQFPHFWPFVRGIHRSPVNSPHKGQWRGALMFSLNSAWING